VARKAGYKLQRRHTDCATEIAEAHGLRHTNRRSGALIARKPFYRAFRHAKMCELKNERKNEDIVKG
jgi:hypothetical protein